MLNKDLIKRIRDLINFCRSKKISIIYTQHSIKSDKSNAEMGEPEKAVAE